MVMAIGLLLGLGAAFAAPTTVSAHTGFESSTPSSGSEIEEPVDLVTIVFTGESTPVGDEFIALTPAGIVQQAASFETVDNKVFSVRFDPPLAGGQVGVRWNVQAADAHPIEGAFAFTVNTNGQSTTAATATGASLDEFLETNDSGGIGQVAGLVGVAGALAAVVIAVVVLRGRRDEAGERRAATEATRVTPDGP
jgi:methionine-rich copper-binding protein CopC